MPIKPSTVFSWANTTNFTVGARIGSPTKLAPIGNEGLIPGTNAAPEQINYGMHWAGNWLTDWVDLGTSAPDLDAHIVETDSGGISNIGKLFLGASVPTTGDVLRVDATNHTNPQASVFIGASATAINASSSNALSTITSIQNGTGSCINADCNGTGPAVDAEGLGTGVGVLAAAAANHAIDATTSAAGFSGVRGTGASAAGGVGVLGRSGHQSSNGVTGENLNAGGVATTRTHAGVQGRALDSSGVYGESTNGYGVVAESDTTSPARGSFRQVPQDTEPSVGLHGDRYVDSVKSISKFFEDSNWKVEHASLRGFVGVVSGTASGTNNAIAFVTHQTVSAFAPNAAKEIGTVIVTATMQLRNEDLSTHHVKVRLRDTTAGVNITTQEFYLAVPNGTVVGASGNGYEKSITVRAEYTLPAVGNRSYDCQIEVDPGGGAGIGFNDLVLTVQGVY